MRIAVPIKSTSLLNYRISFAKKKCCEYYIIYYTTITSAEDPPSSNLKPKVEQQNAFNTDVNLSV